MATLIYCAIYYDFLFYRPGYIIKYSVIYDDWTREKRVVLTKIYLIKLDISSRTKTMKVYSYKISKCVFSIKLILKI